MRDARCAMRAGFRARSGRDAEQTTTPQLLFGPHPSDVRSWPGGRAGDGQCTL